jgi:hypothetical protein
MRCSDLDFGPELYLNNVLKIRKKSRKVIIVLSTMLPASLSTLDQVFLRRVSSNPAQP